MPAHSLDFTFSKDVVPGVVLTNFWAPEDGFVWSTSSWCEVGFNIPDGNAWVEGGGEVLLDLDVFRAAPDLEGQNIHIYVNGLRLATRYVVTRSKVVAELTTGWLRQRGNLISIDTPDAARPIDYGEADTRRLGIKLFSVQVRGV